MDFSQSLLILILAALIGGVLAKLVKLHSLLGFIIAGVVIKLFSPQNFLDIERMTQLGLILLLFTTGLDISFEKLTKVFKIALLGAILQIILASGVCFIFLSLFGIDKVTAIVLSLGFSLSSTAVVIKILTDRDELETVHGGIMVGWLLVQDLMVIPMLIFVNFLAERSGNALAMLGISLIKALLVIVVIILIGRLVAPRLLHWIASFNSRELLLLAAILLALATALATSAFGISAYLGAFLAGVVISQSLEKYTIFAEVRPLRDIFTAVFFVSLGLFVTPFYLLPNLGIIIGLTVVVILVKFVTNFLVSVFLGYHGKTAIAVSIGLSQIGEFSFILFSLGRSLSLISDRALTIGVTAAILSLVVFPMLYKGITPFWRKLREVSSKYPALNKYFAGWDRSVTIDTSFHDHVVICGYGRVGSWVGKALASLSVPYVVIDYNQNVVNELKKLGHPVIYGDPTEREVLEAAGIVSSKALVLTIPDKTARDGVISLTQTIAPKVKIISRVHSDEDWQKLKIMKVDKIVQPEFEASMAIVRSMLTSMGKTREEVAEKIKSLRVSRALK